MPMRRGSPVERHSLASLWAKICEIVEPSGYGPAWEKKTRSLDVGRIPEKKKYLGGQSRVVNLEVGCGEANATKWHLCTYNCVVNNNMKRIGKYY